jgi:hypothetical protein
MSLEDLTSFNWGIMTPEFIIVGVAALITVIDLFMPKNKTAESSAGSELPRFSQRWYP